MRRIPIAVLALSAFLSIGVAPMPAGAHGQPIDGLESRNSYCTQTASRPYLNKENPACAQAYQGPEGDQPGYDPFESNQANGSSFNANGQVAPLVKEIVPDGQLCGAGRDKYAGFNTPTSAWPYRAYEPGTSILYRYTAWAHHPGQIDLYVSKPGFDPTTEALGWDDLEAQPLATISTNAVNGQSSEYNSPTYEQQITLPDRTGRMLVASIWRRSDSPEVFYYCSDLVLEAGANGEIYNLGAVEGNVAPPSTPGQPAQPEQPTSTVQPAAEQASTTVDSATGQQPASLESDEPLTEVAGQVVLVPGASPQAGSRQPAADTPATGQTPAAAVSDEAAASQLTGAETDISPGFAWSIFFLGGIFALLLVTLSVLLALVVLGRRNNELHQPSRIKFG